ncbi:MAG: hypothetical protein IPJ77_22540 [Planctomycetes bacterium]|nr:hypothetical protein [Planctomycetota bacterium]
MVGLWREPSGGAPRVLHRFGRFLCVVLVASACRTTTQESPVGAQEFTPTQATVQETWEVRSGLELHGFVVRYASNDAPPRIYFLVQNRDRQDLGLIDAFGRAWRYQAHERESEWVTTGTVLQGARAILGTGLEAEMVEVRDDGAARPGS